MTCFAGATVHILTQKACSDAALDYLAEIGYDPIYGARPLQVLILLVLLVPKYKY